MTGIPLCARFSLPTNRLGFCGTAEAGDSLRRAIEHGRDIEGAGKALRTFEALYPYLETIGEAVGLDALDARVVEAYWIGNDLLDRDWREPYRALFARLTTRGLPRSLAARLAAGLPEGAIPHHTFHVLFVGVGAVTGHVPTTLANMERCRVSWGTVRRLDEGAVTIQGPQLSWNGRRFDVGNPRTLKVERDAALVPGVEAGGTVAVHWDNAVNRLEEERLAALDRYTRRSIDAANEAAQVLGAAKDL